MRLIIDGHDPIPMETFQSKERFEVTGPSTPIQERTCVVLPVVMDEHPNFEFSFGGFSIERCPQTGRYCAQRVSAIGHPVEPLRRHENVDP